MPYTVYVHTCLLSGKSYVGFTSTSMETRWKGHVKKARKGSTAHFQRAILKYGTDAWMHSVLETLSTRPEAIAAERKWIAELQTQVYGYNLTPGGDGGRGSKKGSHLSEETRRKLSLARMGCPSWNKGRPMNEATKQKLRIANSGKPGNNLGKKLPSPSPERLEKMRTSHLGLKHTDETRQKMREAWKRRGPMSEETKRKISASNKGRPSPNRGRKLGPRNSPKPAMHKAPVQLLIVE